jgi:hypothetical protein
LEKRWQTNVAFILFTYWFIYIILGIYFVNFMYLSISGKLPRTWPDMDQFLIAPHPVHYLRINTH